MDTRQREILQGPVDGLSRAAIERLFLAKNTIRTHIQQLLSRLGAHSTLEAVAIAREAGMRAQPRSPAEPSRPDRADPGAGARTDADRGPDATIAESQ